VGDGRKSLKRARREYDGMAVLLLLGVRKGSVRRRRVLSWQRLGDSRKDGELKKKGTINSSRT
jgi:hypothetical protein